VNSIIIGTDIQSDEDDVLVLGHKGKVLLKADFSKVGAPQLTVADMGGDGLFENIARVFEVMARSMRESAERSDAAAGKMN